MSTPIRSTWAFLLIDPWEWFLLCFFQPFRFSQKFEIQSTFASRFVFMIRMILPLLLVFYIPTLVIRSALLSLAPDTYGHYLPILFPINNLVYFLLDTLWAGLISIMLSPLVGAIFGVTIGIAFGLSGGIWAGVTVNTGITTPRFLIVLSIILLVDGSIVGTAIGGVRATTARLGPSTIGSSIGFVTAMLLGIPTGIVGGYWGAGISNIFFGQLPLITSTAGSVFGATIGLLLSAAVVFAFNSIVKDSFRQIRFTIIFERVFSIGTVFCIAAGGLAGSAAGTNVTQADTEPFSVFFAMMIGTVILPNSSAIISGTLGFILGYFRLPLYPFSGFSTLRAYRASRKKPLKVFDFLHMSSLYWDEHVPLPLPGLKQMLLLSLAQDSNQTLKEIAFIAKERPSQLTQAQAVSLEIALSRLEVCENLEQFSGMAPHLSELLSRDAAFIDARQVPLVAWLADASKEAVRYYSVLTRQSRRDALNEMIIHLNHVQPEKVLEDPLLSKRLSSIVDKLLILARQELDKLEQTPEVVGYIDNPYISGAALKSNNRLFVGRRDLVRQLEQALDKGVHRPTFFLTGERRMGKTSTLNQLSILLSTRYIPIVLDLQARGTSANTSAFLSTIAEVIYQATNMRGIWLENKLDYYYLKEMSRENAAVAYRYFDEWFRYVEIVLDKKDQTLLLAFDEFEKLEEADTADYLDLKLLLDWFRNIIQNHSRLALLFSGVKTLAEMGPQWAGYFVNVKTLRVGLLRPADASRLITQPLSGYPSKEFWDESVINEIMRVTGNHPFLIQAICSELIDLLNANSYKKARPADVATAANEVLEGWWATYFRDLWERTSTEQRLCLEKLHFLGKATLAEIMQSTALDERTVGQALLVLQKRDLILHEESFYSIIAPIFSTWVERSSAS